MVCSLFSSFLFPLLSLVVQLKWKFGRDLPKSESTVPCKYSLNHFNHFQSLPEQCGFVLLDDVLNLKKKNYKIQGREYRKFFLLTKKYWLLIPKSTKGAVGDTVILLLDLDFPVKHFCSAENSVMSVLCVFREAPSSAGTKKMLLTMQDGHPRMRDRILTWQLLRTRTDWN